MMLSTCEGPDSRGDTGGNLLKTGLNSPGYIYNYENLFDIKDKAGIMKPVSPSWVEWMRILICCFGMISSNALEPSKEEQPRN